MLCTAFCKVGCCVPMHLQYILLTVSSLSMHAQNTQHACVALMCSVHKTNNPGRHTCCMSRRYVLMAHGKTCPPRGLQGSQVSPQSYIQLLVVTCRDLLPDLILQWAGSAQQVWQCDGDGV
jgi:hypothetical protein